ncbi:MAG: type II secretion system protein [Planctomycetes bacterium]|nr:type II secretion system protein [Planctomycetota bacterium]
MSSGKGPIRPLRPGAFTLIELLVVIAIISLLMAVLVPSLRAARRLTQRVTCGAKLQQITMAWHMYFDDYDGRFYKGVNANLKYGGWIGAYDWWPRPLNPYLNMPVKIEDPEETQVFQCPADRGGAPGQFVRRKVYTLMGNCYGTNVFLIGQNANGQFSVRTKALDEALDRRNSSLSITQVSSPARLLLLGDYGWFNQWKPDPPDREAQELAEWHGRDHTFNLAYLDGHIEFLEIQRGYYITDEYTVVPFKDLYGLAQESQGAEEP